MNKNIKKQINTNKREKKQKLRLTENNTFPSPIS